MREQNNWIICDRCGERASTGFSTSSHPNGWGRMDTVAVPSARYELCPACVKRAVDKEDHPNRQEKPK